jgi:acetylornithine deacetylase/succinyl-diaminopimelate desuccinylase-like protein
MARIVDFFQTAYAANLRLRKHPLLGRATISVGSINGGTQANIVPDYCVMTADRRTLPGETESSVEREILSMLRKKKLKAQIERGKLAPCLPLETNPRLPLVAAFMRSIGQSRPLGVDYFCDAAILAQGGTPSVVFGPGDIAQAHTSDEWISVKELEQAKSMLVQFLSSLP